MLLEDLKSYRPRSNKAILKISTNTEGERGKKLEEASSVAPKKGKNKKKSKEKRKVSMNTDAQAGLSTLSTINTYTASRTGWKEVTKGRKVKNVPSSDFPSSDHSLTKKQQKKAEQKAKNED